MFNISFKNPVFKVAFVGAGNVLNAVLGFMFLTAIARTLDLYDFGKYALLTSILVFISRIMDFGTNSTYVSWSISNERKQLTEGFYTAKIVLFALTLPFSLLALFYFNLFEPLFLFLFFSGLLAYGINYTLFAFFQKLQKYALIVLLNLLPAIIKGSFALSIFFGLFEPTLNSAFTIFALSIFSSALLLVFAPKEHGFTKLSYNRFLTLLNKSLPAGISQLVVEGWPALNNGIAKVIRGFSDVGIFSLANKISNIFSLISLSIFTVLLPKNAHLKKAHQQYDFKETLLMAGGVMVLALLAVALARPLVLTVFGEKFSESIGLLSILIFASALSAIHSFMENYFFVIQKANYILYINLSKTVTLLSVIAVFFGNLSLKHLAYANLAAALVAVGATIIFVKKTQKELRVSPPVQMFTL